MPNVVIIAQIANSCKICQKLKNCRILQNIAKKCKMLQKGAKVTKKLQIIAKVAIIHIKI